MEFDHLCSNTTLKRTVSDVEDYASDSSISEKESLDVDNDDG